MPYALFKKVSIIFWHLLNLPVMMIYGAALLGYATIKTMFRKIKEVKE